MPSYNNAARKYADFTDFDEDYDDSMLTRRTAVAPQYRVAGTTARPGMPRPTATMPSPLAGGMPRRATMPNLPSPNTPRWGKRSQSIGPTCCSPGCQSPPGCRPSELVFNYEAGPFWWCGGLCVSIIVPGCFFCSPYLANLAGRFDLRAAPDYPVDG